MGMLNIHADALANKAACYHEFLTRYSKSKSIVYGFVEGKEDPCFYRGFIENQLPEGWEVELWPAGNKKQVYFIHSTIDWRRFPKKRICFFVDRDLSELIPETLPKDSNIYVTDRYSIENDIVNRATCYRVLTEVCGLNGVAHDELDVICDLFDQEFEKFMHALVPVMSWVLTWRRIGKKASLSDILMRDIFSIVHGKVSVINLPKGKASIQEYIHDQCNLVVDMSVDINNVASEFITGDVFKKFTRGKYLFWFLIEFCCSVRKSALTLFKSCKKLPAMHVSLSASNGLTVIGNRARIPVSLRTFLDDTFCAYIATKVA